jgi:hypothetical protein
MGWVYSNIGAVYTSFVVFLYKEIENIFVILHCVYFHPSEFFSRNNEMEFSKKFE